MAIALLILHILVCFALIFIVLVQGGKGAELGAAFGAGSSQTVFGGRGAATFLNKATTVVAVVFMITSLLLAIVSVRGQSVVESARPAPTAPVTAPLPGEAPAAPAVPSTPVAPGQQQAPAAPSAPEQAPVPPSGQ
jgi:preprotein translocase subunit SecG